MMTNIFKPYDVGFRVKSLPVIAGVFSHQPGKGKFSLARFVKMKKDLTVQLWIALQASSFR